MEFSLVKEYQGYYDLQQNRGSIGLNSNLLSGMGMIGLFGKDTELALHTPYANGLRHYILTSIYELYNNTIEDTFTNVINLEEVVKKSLPSNLTTPNQYNGLIHLIADNLSHQLKKSYKVQIMNNELVFLNVTGTKDELDKDVLVIDGRNNKTHLLMEYFGILYEHMLFCMNSLKLANKPVYKILNLRADNSSFDKSFIKDQVENSQRALQRMHGLAIMDSEDSIELIQNDVSKYQVMLDIGWGGISQVTSLPRSYLDKSIAGGLNTNGEGDIMVAERTFERTWINYLEPIIARIYEILGYEKKYVYAEYMIGKLRGIADLLPILERTELLDDEQKVSFVTSILGVGAKEVKQQPKEDLEND